MSARAQGESYQYVNSDTISATGGIFTKSDDIPDDAKFNFTKFGENATHTFFHANVLAGVYDGQPCTFIFDLHVNKSDGKGNLTKVTHSSGNSALCEALKQVVGPDGRALLTTADSNFTIAAAPGGTGDDAAQSEARCELESLGWIICPILTISSKIITALGNMLDSLLFFEPLSIPTSTDLNSVPKEQQAYVAIFVVWQNVRNLANILFLLFFLFAIFSIATSMGTSNYNIKKMLPRIVIAAILINLSYYLFAFAIDITNILGKGVAGVFNVAIPSAPEPTAEIGDLGLYGIGAIAGLGAVAITGTLAALLLPFVAGVVVGILLLLLLVLFREIAIVFLVVLSPLAAVLWILPNTESVSKKFVTTSRNLLLIYPFLMAAVAVSNLAAQLILAIGYANQ